MKGNYQYNLYYKCRFIILTTVQQICILRWINTFSELRAGNKNSSHLLSNLTCLIQYGPGDPTPGKLDRGQSVATALQNFFTFFCYFTPMLGAIVADQYVGRYWTIIIFSTVYMIGWLILTCTALPVSLEHGSGFPGYVVSLVVIGCKYPKEQLIDYVLIHF